MGEELPRSGVYGSRGRVAPLSPRALLILFAFCLSSFPRLLPLRGSSFPRSAFFGGLFSATSPSVPSCPCGAWGLNMRLGSPCGSVQVSFCGLLQCKNAHPEITPNLSGPGLKFNISLSSIDRCPPFRPKRKDKGGDNLRLKTDRRFSRAEPPSRAPGPG